MALPCLEVQGSYLWEHPIGKFDLELSSQGRSFWGSQWICDLQDKWPLIGWRVEGRKFANKGNSAKSYGRKKHSKYKNWKKVSWKTEQRSCATGWGWSDLVESSSTDEEFWYLTYSGEEFPVGRLLGFSSVKNKLEGLPWWFSAPHAGGKVSLPDEETEIPCAAGCGQKEQA